MIGCNQADDSGVMRLSDDMALIQTVDFFPAVVDDPYVFGQVAAANSLSDVYAMGGAPLCALNIVCFPAHEAPLDMLGEVLRGGVDKVNEAGAVIVGGHTIKDSELKYGLAVSGIIHPDKIFSIGGARPGDRLVITKPLGSGIYSTALKNGALTKEHELALYEVMSTLNAAACEQMIAFSASACTDVTGFGLVGHALEMAQASDVTFRIEVAALPLLPSVMEYAEKGYLTGGGMSNRQFAADEIELVGRYTPATEMLLCDPQTSGGLLVSIPGDEADAYIRSLRERGVEDAAIIGEVRGPGEKRLEIVAG